MNDVIDNPLNAFKYPEFIAAIAEHLDVFVSLEGYQESYKAGMPMVKSPISNMPLCGALAFGYNYKHAEVTDYTLSVLLAGGKLLGNQNLWFAVVYFIIKGRPTMRLEGLAENQMIKPSTVLEFKVRENVKNTMERLAEMIPLYENHLRWRLVHRKTFASLSGLSQFVCTKIPIASAVWYILHSCFMNHTPDLDPLRMHIGNVEMFLQMMDLVEYPVNTAALMHINRLRGMLALLRAVKAEKYKDFHCSSFMAY